MATTPEKGRDEYPGQDDDRAGPLSGVRGAVELSGATDGEVTRLREIAQQIRSVKERLKDEVPGDEYVVQPWHGDLDDCDRLSREQSAILDAIRLRNAPGLRPSTDADRENLEDD